MSFELSAASVAFDCPRRLTDIASWHGHIPFAFWCVEALTPRVIVELGTHRGDSYSAFCQAVERLSLPCACFAVDTWRGDLQAGHDGEDVLAELRSHHDGRYGHFSTLVRATFEEAAARFADGSIDLLHIDGNHGFEAARADFETYLPKLSRRAVVLLHDTNVREADFGVSRLWEELSARYPHFEFLHSHGLGVLAVGEEAPEPVRALAASSPAQVEEIRRLFAHLGTAAAAPAERARLAAEVYARAAADLLSERADLERREEQRRTELERLDAEVRKLRGALEWAGRKLDELQRSAPWRIGCAITSVRRIPGKAMHAVGVLARILYWAVTFQLRTGLRRRRQARIIRRSGLFQPEHYLAQLREAREARRDPIWHFLVHGAAGGLDPNPFFVTAEYMARHPESAAAGENPLVHYARTGGRTVDPGPRFDTAFYLALYPQVAASPGNPLAYYLAHGAADGQMCHPSMLPEARARALADELLASADSLVRQPGPPRTLVVDHRMLMPDHDSGSVRLFAIVKLLRALGHEVTFASDNPERYPRHEADVRRIGVEVLHGFAEIAAHLEQEGQRYAFVVLSRPEVADRYLAAARAHAIHARVVYDTVDLHWVRLLRAAEATGNASLRFEAERFRVLERFLARSADVVLAITPDEKQALLAEVPGARVEVVPNIHACRPPTTPWAARTGLMFIGGFEHVPNVDAIEWFVGSILPLVQRELPGVVLHVVGSKAPESLRRLAAPDVSIDGYVPDPTGHFEASRVFVAPLRYGAGMKGKIGHAMSHGLPVVTTSIGAEGMGLVDGENALVADAPAAFAAAVVRLYRDELLWSKISKASLLHLQQRFSDDAMRATVASIFPPGAAHAAQGDAAPARPADAAIRSATR